MVLLGRISFVVSSVVKCMNSGETYEDIIDHVVLRLSVHVFAELFVDIS